MKMRDKGLSYEAAGHAVQSAIAFKMEKEPEGATTPKHLRVGIDMSKSDMLGLVMLLMNKGVITEDEYEEYVRVAANEELAMHEDDINKRYGGKGSRITFR